MWQDPIVAEIHQARDRISEAHGDDLHAIFAAAQRGDLVKALTTAPVGVGSQPAPGKSPAHPAATRAP